jgi:hypothetical protein
MIVLSAGMPKAGSGWYFNLTNDLLIAAGHRDVREIRQEFHLQSILRHHNCNIGAPNRWKLLRTIVPHLLGHSYTVKTHGRPTSTLHLLLYTNVVRTTYIHRDPRDVVISAFEHGEKLRERGETHTFAKYTSIKASISIVANEYLATSDAWTTCSQAMPSRVLITRYEDLVANTLDELNRLADFLALCAPPDSLHKIADTYQSVDGRADGEALHFNKGTVGRFRSLMTPEELELSRLRFGSYLRRMGYAE